MGESSELYKMKQKLQQLKKNIQTRDSIEAQIENLKQQFKEVTHDYYRNAYNILSKIMVLRNIQLQERNKRFKRKSIYGLNRLCKEKGINLTRHQIYQIFLQDYFTPTTRHLIENNRIKTSSALAIIRRSQEYREPRFQDKMMMKHVNGELKIDEIMRVSPSFYKGDKNANFIEMKRANSDMIHISYQLKNILKTLKSKENLFAQKNILQQNIHTCEKIIKELETIKKFGKQIK